MAKGLPRSFFLCKTLADKRNKKLSYRRNERGRREAVGEERGMAGSVAESVLMQLLSFFTTSQVACQVLQIQIFIFLPAIKLSLKKTKHQAKALLLSRWRSSSMV